MAAGEVFQHQLAGRSSVQRAHPITAFRRFHDGHRAHGHGSISSLQAPSHQAPVLDEWPRPGPQPARAGGTSTSYGGPNQREIPTPFISEKTASVHVSNIMNRLGAANRSEVAVIAHRLLEPYA